MKDIPEVLNNPNNPLFNFEEAEIYSIKEALELISIEKYAYSLFAIWNCVVINIQRRIEKFGINNFLNILENKTQFNKEGNNLKDRWLNINEHELIDYAQKLNIINHVSHDLITTLYWLKSNTNETETNALLKEELFALLFLLEKNLFIKEFKTDQRLEAKEEDRRHTNRGGRRKKDNQDIINTNSSTTHQELLLKSGVKKFSNNLNPKDKDDKLLATYI